MENIIGKTYSLYGNSTTTVHYFQTVKEIVDHLLQKQPGEQQLLDMVQKTSKDKGIFKKLFKYRAAEKLFYFNEEKIDTALSKFTSDVKKHLKGLSLFQRFDATLTTKEHQYYLYMLEIELVNRIYKHTFKNCEPKIAFLPHCLRDFRLKCLSYPDDIDHICKGCTKNCYINYGSVLLKKYRIKPYISVVIDQPNLFKQLKQNYPHIGMLGVACVPELVRGMRLCMSLNIPAVGIPLDANNCARWRGQAFETTFNLKELEKLVR